MVYLDREEAAQLLAQSLKAYMGQSGVVVAIPRGGLPIGYVIAQHLHFPLEVALIKKIGHPTNPEYAIGSVSLSSRIVSQAADVSNEYIESETLRLRDILQQRSQLYRGNVHPLSMKDKVVIITDDGVATGRSMLAAIDLIKKDHPKKIVVAVPVAAPAAITEIRHKVDELICLQAPGDFYAVGKYYRNFDQISDHLAAGMLKRARTIIVPEK